MVTEENHQCRNSSHTLKEHLLVGICEFSFMGRNMAGMHCFS